MAIMGLAFHEFINVTTEKRKPFNTSLRTAKWINVYGNVEAVPAHMKAVLDLITLREELRVSNCLDWQRELSGECAYSSLLSP